MVLIAGYLYSCKINRSKENFGNGIEILKVTVDINIVDMIGAIGHTLFLLGMTMKCVCQLYNRRG